MQKKLSNFKVVIFGGTPKWIKAIQPLVPDAKYYPVGSKPQTAYIAHADMIFIQTFGIDHSTSRAIRAIADHLHIPCCYFGSKAAVECAKIVYRASLARCA